MIGQHFGVELKLFEEASSTYLVISQTLAIDFNMLKKALHINSFCHLDSSTTHHITSN